MIEGVVDCMLLVFWFVGDVIRFDLENRMKVWFFFVNLFLVDWDDLINISKLIKF